MNRALLTAISLVLLTFFFSTVVYAGYPDTCEEVDRESPLLCKWVPDSMITSAEYVVEMEYPMCRHYIYLEGLAVLPPGDRGSFISLQEPKSYEEYRGLSPDYIFGAGVVKWELVGNKVRISAFPPGANYQYNRDFSVESNRPYFQDFVYYNLPPSKVIFRAHIERRAGTGTYPVVIGELPSIENINNHESLAWSCYEQLHIEKKRREELIKIEEERVRLEQSLIIHRAHEQAKIEAENLRLAQEKANAEKRLEITKQVSEEIDAANAAWLLELQAIRIIEQQIQDELNQRTLAAIENARQLKDEYIAIKTLQMEEARRRSALLNEWYAEALLSWQDFEDLANRTWAEISVNENEVERVKSEIQSIQDSFDQTLLEIQQRIEQFNLEHQQDNS